MVPQRGGSDGFMNEGRVDCMTRLERMQLVVEGCSLAFTVGKDL